MREEASGQRSQDVGARRGSGERRADGAGPRGGLGPERGARAGDGRDLPRGRARAPAMDSVAWLAALLAVLALQAGHPAEAVTRGDTFSALTSVARALAPERRLLGLLRRYLRGEEARLRDLTR